MNTTHASSALSALKRSDDSSSRLHRPVLTFHPRLNLSNIDISNIIASSHVAQMFGQKPLLVSYPYDLGTRKGSGVDRSAIGVRFEETAVSILPDSRVGSYPLCAVKGFTQKDVQNFAGNLRTAFKQASGRLKLQLNNVQLGHPLFPLKSKAYGEHLERTFDGSLEKMTHFLQGAVGTDRSLSDQLAYYNAAMATDLLGTELDVEPMDHILANDEELWDVIAETYPQMEAALGPMVKVTAKHGERLDVISCGDHFTAGERELSSKDLADLAKARKVTIQGPLFFAVLNHMGYGTTTVGKRATHYDSLFDGARKISQLWGESFNLKYLIHDVEIAPDYCNLSQVTALSRVFEKVAGRNLCLNGEFNYPGDIADHLAFLAGNDAVPEELVHFAQPQEESALARKQQQATETRDMLQRLRKGQLTEDDLSHIKKKHRCPSTEPAYLQRVLEEATKELESYCGQLQTDIRFETQILGGTKDGIFRNGVFCQNGRYPNATDLMLSGQELTMPAMDFDPASESPYCLGRVYSSKRRTLSEQRTFRSGPELFDHFFRPDTVPFNLLQPAKPLGP